MGKTLGSFSEGSMELKIIDKEENHDFFWVRAKSFPKGFTYTLRSVDRDLGFRMFSIDGESSKKVQTPYYFPKRELLYPSNTTDEVVLMEVTNIFLMMDRFSPAFPTEAKHLKKVGDYAIGTCSGFFGRHYIQVHGLRKLRGQEGGIYQNKNADWSVFMEWDIKTGKARGYSRGLKAVSGNWMRCKRENLQISEPEDIASWASVVLRIEGLL